MISNKKNSQGYIAITSAIILTIIIMIVSVSLSTSSVSNRFDILGTDLKKTSRVLAEACANTALAKLAENSSYSGNENINIGNSACSILSIATSSNQSIIKTTANLQNYVTNLKITASSSPVSIISWEEMANF